MQKLKDLGFDGIEGSAPGLQIEPMKKHCQRLIFPCTESFTTNTGKSDSLTPTRKSERKAVKDSLRL